MNVSRSPRIEAGLVTLLLITQAGLLGYSATRHSPTDLEPAFLASGISHWEFGRFEPYRVNPPLVRMVAAIPVIAVGHKSDWSNYYEGPGARAEFPLGEAFLKANGKDVIPLFFYARWACIPFSLIGAFFAYRWSRELYGPPAGLVTLLLYVFEPNLLAHGELITPDAACTAFGILAGYTFWKWQKQPTWTRAALAGGALGLAELSKMSWLILFGLWPVLWLIWRWLERRSSNPARATVTESSPKQWLPSSDAESKSTGYPKTVNQWHEEECVTVTEPAHRATVTESSPKQRVASSRSESKSTGCPKTVNQWHEEECVPVTESAPRAAVTESSPKQCLPSADAESKSTGYPKTVNQWHEEECATASESSPTQCLQIKSSPSFAQLMLILGLAVYLINLGYAFDGTGTLLKDFKFVSTALTGLETPGTTGNRFQSSWLGQILMPVPAQFVLGFDLQKKDFEKFHHRSYLRGEWRDHGWWYYYLYGLLVKVPCGIWGILVLVVGSRLSRRTSRIVPGPDQPSSRDSSPRFRDEMILLTPAIALLALVSSQTEFSIHLRYAFPTLGLVLIYLGQSGRYVTKSTPVRAVAIGVCLLYAVTSSMLTYPHHLAYFNDFIGGPRHGHKHLLGSSLDWGQGTLEAVEWLNEHEPTDEVEFEIFSPTIAAILRGTENRANHDTVTSPRSPKLILYSADRYSERGENQEKLGNTENEQDIITFPNGRRLVRRSGQ